MPPSGGFLRYCANRKNVVNSFLGNEELSISRILFNEDREVNSEKMFAFLENEKGILKRYARETWLVLCGKYAMTEMNGVDYHVCIDQNTVRISRLENDHQPLVIPTVKFKAMLEMFRGWD